MEAVGPALPARATYPQLDPGELRDLLTAHGDTYSDPSRTHLSMASQGFAILGAGRVILVDTCLGGAKPDRPRPRAGFTSRWPSALAAAGISPQHVDTVINTHLHHDHVGWNTTFADGRLRPTFPMARYLITGKSSPTRTASGRPPTSSTACCRSKPRDSWRPATPTPASTTRSGSFRHPGTPLATSWSTSPVRGKRAVLAADLIHHPLQLRRSDVSAAMCTDVHQSAATRTQILQQYADTDTLFLPSHFPRGGYLHSARDGWRLAPA